MRGSQASGRFTSFAGAALAAALVLAGGGLGITAEPAERGGIKGR